MTRINTGVTRALRLGDANGLYPNCDLGGFVRITVVVRDLAVHDAVSVGA
jgi:hypothetical protein